MQFGKVAVSAGKWHASVTLGEFFVGALRSMTQYEFQFGRIVVHVLRPRFCVRRNFPFIRLFWWPKRLFPAS
jgi:hypothetical protein